MPVCTKITGNVQSSSCKILAKFWKESWRDSDCELLGQESRSVAGSNDRAQSNDIKQDVKSLFLINGHICKR